MTQLRSIEITSRSAVTLSIQLCNTAHKQIIATAYPVYSVPRAYSGQIKMLDSEAPTQSSAEFNAGEPMWCAATMGSGTNEYVLLTPSPAIQLYVANYRVPGQTVFDVLIPFGASYDPSPSAAFDDCSNPRQYTYSVTNGSRGDEDFTAADELVAGTIRLNIKPTEKPTSNTSAVSICGITVP